jgi:Subtilase family
MKKIYLLLIFLSSQFYSFAQIINPTYIDNEVYVKVKKSTFKASQKSNSTVNINQELSFLLNYSNFEILSAAQPFYFNSNQELQQIYRLKIKKDEQVFALMNTLKSDSNIIYIERIPVNKLIYNTNDPNAGSQYHLNTVKALNAWDLTTGGVDIPVAIVDDAVQTDHPDLAANCLPGRDVADGDDDPRPPSTSYSHGTHVAGIVGAVNNNSIGVASVSFNKAKIIPVRASNSPGYITHGYEGIAWAATHGAKIINMSWGGGGSSITDQAVIDDAFSRGIVIIASAGNSASSSVNYPAGYNNVVSVVSTTSTDQISSFSSYGSWVDICAPGSSILSTVPFGSYDTYSGTSMASPLTASCFAFIWSTKPDFTNTQIINWMKANTDNIDALNPGYVGLLGAGRINVLKALSCTEVVSAITPAGPISICPGKNITLSATPNPELTYQWKKDGVNVGINSSVYSPTTPGIYNLILSKPGCSISSNQVQVSQYPTTVAVSSSRNPATICGDSVILSTNKY